MPAPGNDPPPAASSRPRRRGRGPAVLFLVLFLAAGLGALYVWMALSYSYSDGERAGYLQKFSRKGWICKSWEGEIAMVSLPGTPAQIFAFTVRDPAVAAGLGRIIGQRVAIHYEQHRGVPTSCFGETEYYVTSARPVPPQP